jgi:hypothetical protein
MTLLRNQATNPDHPTPFGDPCGRLTALVPQGGGHQQDWTGAPICPVASRTVSSHATRLKKRLSFSGRVQR